MLFSTAFLAFIFEYEAETIKTFKSMHVAEQKVYFKLRWSFESIFY